ncbi:MAG: hypothetical protein PVF58_02600 [Candidatus Methanofastidiosia archaeon]|jgi:hypothetical protein
MNKTISSSEMLQASSDGLFNALLSIISPVFGGIDYVKRIRKSYLIKKELDALIRKKIEFLSALTNIVPDEASYEEYAELREKFQEIQESPEFRSHFQKLNQLFESLSQQDQRNIILITSNKTKKMFLDMRKQISDNLIEASDTENMIVLGQALKCGLILIDDIIISMSKTPPKIDDIKFHINLLLVLLTKFMAINMNLMNPQVLYGDIALCMSISFLTGDRSETVDPSNDSAFIILEDNE